MLKIQACGVIPADLRHLLSSKNHWMFVAWFESSIWILKLLNFDRLFGKRRTWVIRGGDPAGGQKAGLREIAYTGGSKYVKQESSVLRPCEPI